MPAWLNQEFLNKQILPLLKDIKVRLIAEAIGVSSAYAAQIRCGPRKAHPRHWQMLAKLVGISQAAIEKEPTFAVRIDKAIS